MSYRATPSRAPLVIVLSLFFFGWMCSSPPPSVTETTPADVQAAGKKVIEAMRVAGVKEVAGETVELMKFQPVAKRENDEAALVYHITHENGRVAILVIPYTETPHGFELGKPEVRLPFGPIEQGMPFIWSEGHIIAKLILIVQIGFSIVSFVALEKAWRTPDLNPRWGWMLGCFAYMPILSVGWTNGAFSLPSMSIFPETRGGELQITLGVPVIAMYFLFLRKAKQSEGTRE